MSLYIDSKYINEVIEYFTANNYYSTFTDFYENFKHDNLYSEVLLHLINIERVKKTTPEGQLCTEFTLSKNKHCGKPNFKTLLNILDKEKNINFAKIQENCVVDIREDLEHLIQMGFIKTKSLGEDKEVVYRRTLTNELLTHIRELSVVHINDLVKVLSYSDIDDEELEEELKKLEAKGFIRLKFDDIRSQADKSLFKYTTKIEILKLDGFVTND